MAFESEMNVCGWCLNPCDGKFHHWFCYEYFYRQKFHLAQDMQGSNISFPTVIGLNVSASRVAELDWSQVEIRSHPVHKQELNAQAVYLQKEKRDVLGLLQRFWATVTWTTDENICPLILSVIVDGKVKRIIGLSCWSGGRNVAGEYAKTHPIVDDKCGQPAVIVGETV